MIITSIILSTLALLIGTWLGRLNPARSSSLTAGMILLILVSPLLILSPKLTLNLPFINQTLPTTTHLTESNTSILIPSIWAIITTFLLTRIYLHHRAIKKILKQSTPHNSPQLTTILNQSLGTLDLKKSPHLHLSHNIQSPIVTGLLHPTILLPQASLTWTPETLRMVILHELGHIRRRDLWKTLAAHITCAIHWFNPIVWILKKQLIAQAEFACDAHIISKGTDAKSYILALCDVASIASKQNIPTAALAMAGQAPLKKRVETLLAGNQQTNTLLTTTILALTASTTLALTLIRPTTPLPTVPTNIPTNYTPKEINARLTANPFPND